MNRRKFIAAATTTAAVTSVVSAHAAEADRSVPPAREFYELRRYHLRRGPKQKIFDDYLKEAWLPAMGRLGVGPIGIFNLMLGPNSPSVYILVPYKSIEDFAATPARLRQDAEYLKAGAEASQATAAEPVYLEVESWLLGAFSGLPKIEVPAQTRAGKPRIFELRTYRSHNKRANLKKIEMFNEGEIAIFRRTGLIPVFFGETLVGSGQPNLTYLLVFDDLAARDNAWRTFGGDPEWRKLSGTAGYTDAEIVTDITNVLLRPTSYSQL